MNEVEKLIRETLPSKNIIQLATSSDKSPWICTVHYYSDDQLNFYWLSTPDRRHSEEIANNPKTSGYLLMHENTPEHDYVIGLTFEGVAHGLGHKVDTEIYEGYCKKFADSKPFLDEVLSGKDPHEFYRLTPTKFVLFDTKNFKNNPRQEWTIK